MPECICGFQVQTMEHLQAHLNFYVHATRAAERLGRHINVRHGVA